MIKHDPTIPRKDSEILATARWTSGFEGTRRAIRGISRCVPSGSQRFEVTGGQRCCVTLSANRQSRSVAIVNFVARCHDADRSIIYPVGARLGSPRTATHYAKRSTVCRRGPNPEFSSGLSIRPRKWNTRKSASFEAIATWENVPSTVMGYRVSYDSTNSTSNRKRRDSSPRYFLCNERFAYSGFFSERNNLVRMFLNKRRSYPRLRGRNFSLSRKFSGCQCWIVNLSHSFCSTYEWPWTNNFV